MATIKQIAEICGVSPASVSKALNNAPDISTATAERIKKTALELAYYPNAAARALKTNHSHNIGVMFVDETHCGLTHEYFSQVLNGVKNEAERLGYDISFISQNIGNTHMTYLEHCRYRNCDGVVIACVDFQAEVVKELIQSDIPVVTIDYMYEGRGAVLSDNLQCMRDLVEYVYNRGHRKIAFIHGEDTAVTRQRIQGFKRACKALDITVPEEYIRAAIYHDPKASEIATREILALADRPTCIMYPDDYSYIGGMDELERQGLHVPDDISVVGFDGILLSRVMRPHLTTLVQNAPMLGTEAARMIVEAIETPRKYVPRRVVVPGSVQEGQTVRKI
ncbi:MAG: LacI family DNA-binding transcriptional regulator [Eubacteriales bacterium]|nr:LacI family DNA-binding transcriptional regulator [Eubacteriales bacterium]